MIVCEALEARTKGRLLCSHDRRSSCQNAAQKRRRRCSMHTRTRMAWTGGWKNSPNCVTDATDFQKQKSKWMISQWWETCESDKMQTRLWCAQRVDPNCHTDGLHETLHVALLPIVRMRACLAQWPFLPFGLVWFTNGCVMSRFAQRVDAHHKIGPLWTWFIFKRSCAMLTRPSLQFIFSLWQQAIVIHWADATINWAHVILLCLAGPAGLPRLPVLLGWSHIRQSVGGWLFETTSASDVFCLTMMMLMPVGSDDALSGTTCMLSLIVHRVIRWHSFL